MAAQQTDAAEDGLHGPENSGEELPDEQRRREQRLETIRAVKAPLEAEQAEEDKQKGRQPGDGKLASGKRPPRGRSKFKREFGEPKPAAQRNFSDPESRIMKSKQSFEQCYNAQAVVEEGNQLIVAQQVGQSAADNEPPAIRESATGIRKIPPTSTGGGDDGKLTVTWKVPSRSRRFLRSKV